MPSNIRKYSVLTKNILLAFVAIYFFLWPAAIIVSDIQAPELRNNDLPSFTYRWHKNISKNFASWATDRIGSNRANSLNIDNISGTEWPMFSAVYYLWATESLQRYWEGNPSVSDKAPIDYAQDSIRSAASLVADKGNATWVIKHWGDTYLEQENIFYRMLLISGLTSFEKLLSDNTYHKLLTNQVHSLAEELDNSPYGLLDDYPRQCYPVDVLPAIAAINRAQSLINHDFSGVISRAKRGFSGNLLDPHTLLPAYIADSKQGKSYGPARGVGMSYMLIWSPEIWPELSREWYSKYQTHFWQQNSFIAGVREFTKELPYPDWLMDVDAGPVIAGYGTAASAFGIGAARANGKFDHAFPLSAEALASSWPLPHGTLLIPKLLSNISDAPFIGETALLFNFTRQMIDSETTSAANSKLPLFVYFCISMYLLFGLLLLKPLLRQIMHWRKIARNKQRHSH